MFNPLRNLTRMGWLAVASVALLVVVLILFALTEARRARENANRAHAGQVVAEGGQAATADALAASDKAHDVAIASDQLTGANRDEILSSPGADASVGAVSDAGMRSLCKRAAYADDPRCRAMRAARP